LAENCLGTETQKKQLSVIKALSKKITSRLDINVVDAAIDIAVKLHPYKYDSKRKFQDDSDMREWYDHVREAIDSFPLWKSLDLSDVSSYQGEGLGRSGSYLRPRSYST